jgi:hypothetical protein
MKGSDSALRCAVAAGILLVVSFGSASPALADVVYSQGAVSPVERLLIAEGVQIGPISSLFIPFDNFTLSEAASIDSVEWQGAYADGRGSGTFTAPEAVEFVLQFYDDFGGMPGNLIDPPNIVHITPAAAHETRVGAIADFTDADDLEFGVDLTIYNYQYTFDTPVQLDAGKQYWLGIFAFLPDNPGYDWFRTVGKGSDGASVLLSGSGELPLHFDTVFSLHATDTTSVPEPSSLAFLGTGVFALLMARKRLLQ